MSRLSSRACTIEQSLRDMPPLWPVSASPSDRTSLWQEVEVYVKMVGNLAESRRGVEGSVRRKGERHRC